MKKSNKEKRTQNETKSQIQLVIFFSPLSLSLSRLNVIDFPSPTNDRLFLSTSSVPWRRTIYFIVNLIVEKYLRRERGELERWREQEQAPLVVALSPPSGCFWR